MKVFGIGLSKTGTTSLVEALNMLGIRSIHGPNDPKTIAEFRSRNFNLSVMKKYEGIADIPTSVFYRELDHQFPGSKFIYTHRSHGWIESMSNHYKTSKKTSWKKDIRNWAYGIDYFDREKLLSAYSAHQINVREYFKHSNNYLEMDICNGDGWDKLCPFLGRITLSVEFPFRNHGRSYFPKML